MGDWVRGLIENIHYNDTILPRIPVPAPPRPQQSAVDFWRRRGAVDVWRC
jgi:hypothetical protein